MKRTAKQAAWARSYRKAHRGGDRYGFARCQKLPRKLKKALKKQRPTWPAKRTRIEFHGWVFQNDEFGGDTCLETNFSINDHCVPQFHVRVLSEREAEWNRYQRTNP